VPLFGLHRRLKRQFVAELFQETAAWERPGGVGVLDPSIS
jgi:hypothetical protein